MTQIIFNGNPVAMWITLFVLILLSVEIAYRWGLRSKGLGNIGGNAWGTIQGGLLTLVAFMLGLSYAQAQGRFDTRRDLVVVEANNIGTTWLRADQLSPADTLTFRRTLAEYTAERLQAYSTPNDPKLYAKVIHDSDVQQAAMWRLASSALRERPNDLGRSLLMTTLNDTIDVSAEQLAALTHHVPTAVIVFTFLLVIVGAVSTGLQLARDKSRPVSLVLLYAIALTIVVNLVVDYDRSQVGLVRIPLDPLEIQLRAMQ